MALVPGSEPGQGQAETGWLDPESRGWGPAPAEETRLTS